MQDFKTQPFFLDRLKLVQAVALHYILFFLPILIGLPLFGLLMLVFGPKVQLIQAIALVCFLWPVTIPARVLAVALRYGPAFGVKTWAELDSSGLKIFRDNGKGTFVKKSQFHRVYRRFGCTLLQTRSMHLSLFPPSAFLVGEQDEFENLLRVQAQPGSSA